MFKAELEHPSPEFDYPTLIMISILAYVITTAFHEYLGHAVACILLGGNLSELNAFYIDCQYGTISDYSIRFISVAGPLSSFVTGIVSFILLKRLRRLSSNAVYFFWLLGTISLLTATGYLLFSGITGLGDFGFTRDGALFQMTPTWFWRVLLTIFGLTGYGSTVAYALHIFNKILGGENYKRRIRAKTVTLVSYLSGCIMAVLIGLLNPQGLFIILFSSLASTAGGTSALIWMMRFLKDDLATTRPLLNIKRDYRWIGISFVMLLIFAFVFGPSQYF